MKKFAYLACLILFVLALQSCYSPPPPTPPSSSAPFSIQVGLDKTIYQIGENIVIKVRASRDCYVSIYDISTEGEVTQIFPNRFASDNLIEGGYEYRIPDQADQFDFEIIGPPGMERVRVIGTLGNVNFFDDRTRGKTETFPRISNDSEQFNQALSQKLHSMPPERWTEASITFQVVQ